MAYVGKRKSIRQKLAWVLSAAIVVTSLSFGGATAQAEENSASSSTPKVLDIGEEYTEEVAAKSSNWPGDETQDGFTLMFYGKDDNGTAKGSQVNLSSQTFSDGYEGKARFNTQGTAKTTQASIKFTTKTEAAVKVWWICGGDPKTDSTTGEIDSSTYREMTILDSQGKAVDTTELQPAKNSQYISELSVKEAGTYYLGSSNSSNYIYKVEVTEKSDDTEEPIPPTPDEPGDEDGFVNGLEASAVEEGKSYYYDFTNVTTIPNSYNQGLFSFNAGSYHGASYKDTTYGIEFKSGNELTFPVAGNSFIVVGGDNNNNCTNLTASSGTGIFVKASQSTVTAGHATLDDCKTKGTNTIVYEYQGTKGTVTLKVDPEYKKAEGETSQKAYIAYVCVIPVKDGEGTEIPVGPTDPGAATRTVTYDFTANTGKTAPAVNSILAGTDTVTSGILYMNKGSGSGCSFDSNQLRFRTGVILYLPIKDDTTKVEYSATYSGSNAGRPTYIGSTESGYTMEMNTSAAPVVIDDITDYIQEVNGQKYLSITSGGDIKIYTITLKEYNPINPVEVS